MPKKIYEIDTCCQFHKTFLAKFMMLLAYGFDSDNATNGINNRKKSFMKLTPV
jgi:hypothetical protein